MTDPRRAASVVALLLAACTACWCADAEDKSIPYDTEEECKEILGAEWSNTTCKCSSYYLPAPNRTMCLHRLANAAKACEVSEQCADVMQFGECKSGTCECPDNFHYLHGRCWPSAGLGQSCSQTECCHVNYDPLSATCSVDRHVCECSAGYYTRGGIDCRREATGPGEECGLDNDCRFNGGLCDADTLVCYSNDSSSGPATASTQDSAAAVATVSTPSTSQTPGSPTETAFVGQACENDTWCSGLDNSRCFGDPGRCECVPGSFGENGTTACVKEIGESCNTTADCSGIDYSECRNNTCACAVRYITTSSNRACKTAKKYANSCSPKYPEQCSNYGWWCECLDKPSGDGQQCLCDAGHHFVQAENLCWVSKDLNDSCTDDLDCVVAVGSARCSNSSCQCGPNLHLSRDGSNCVNVTALGDKCATAEDCSELGDNIECSANKCKCATHYYEGTGSNGAQKCLPGFGAPCSSDSSCSKENSVCLENSCACAEGYVTSTNEDMCLEVAETLGANCTEKQQCTQSLGDLSLCQGDHCVCGDDDQFRKGKCRDKKAPGDQCLSSAECYVVNDVSFIECRNKVCQCKFGYSVSHNQQECIPNGAMSLKAVSTIVLLGSLLVACISQ